jgi:ribonuclease Z
MRCAFAPTLINGPFGDPGLFVDLTLAKRALLCDMGDLSALPPKKLLRISDIFVSHTHMDHFCGFDRWLRICLGRETGVRLYGPPGLVEQVGHKLAAYTWNLVQNYPSDFVIEVWEVHPDWHAHGARYRCHARFAAETLPARVMSDGVLLEEEAFAVRTTFLEHRTACLAFAMEARPQLHVKTDRLVSLGVPSGPWLTELKRAVRRGAPEDAPITIAWHDCNGDHQRIHTVGDLKNELLSEARGEKICYVTDVLYTEDNARRITALAADADRLYIECVFLEADAHHAASKCHLTAHQAGALAHRARARAVIPFHFSPRYLHREQALRAELEAAYAGIQA